MITTILIILLVIVVAVVALIFAAWPLVLAALAFLIGWKVISKIIQKHRGEV